MTETILFAALALVALSLVLILRKNSDCREVSPMGSRELAAIAPAGLWRTTPRCECTYVNQMCKDMAGMRDG